MRKLVSFMTVISLTACLGGEALQEKNNLAGTWVFARGALSGSITLYRKRDFEYYWIPGSTTFTINGKQFEINNSSGITVKPRTDGELSPMWLRPEDGLNTYVSFWEGTVDKDYTRIKYRFSEWGINCLEHPCAQGEEGAVIFTRKKK